MLQILVEFDGGLHASILESQTWHLFGIVGRFSLNSCWDSKRFSKSSGSEGGSSNGGDTLLEGPWHEDSSSLTLNRLRRTEGLGLLRNRFIGRGGTGGGFNNNKTFQTIHLVEIL